MKTLLKRFLGLLILLAGVGIAVLAFINRPIADVVADNRRLPAVTVVPAEEMAIALSLPSQGVVEPRKRTAVAAEVGGKIESVAEAFEAGGEFRKGDVLVKIDESDYVAAEAQAKRTVADASRAVADAQLALETEKARAEQARRDWDRLGRTGTPSDLTLRKPHLKSAEEAVKAAEAGLEAAQASLEKAERDRRRTTIVAPFDGRIEKIHTEEGAYLMPGSPVADLYTTAPYEVRLPLSIDDWTLLERDEMGDPVGEVNLTVNAGLESRKLPGKIVRTEGRVERESRSIYLVAEIGEGQEGTAGDPLIQPGLFVKAQVAGKTLDGVFKVPVQSFSNLNEVMVIESNGEIGGPGIFDEQSENRLRFKEVTVLRRSRDAVLVSGGLRDGWWLSTTELPDMISGLPVRPLEKESTEPEIELAEEPDPRP